jgi:hypothetical protein
MDPSDTSSPISPYHDYPFSPSESPDQNYTPLLPLNDVVTGDRVIGISDLALVSEPKKEFHVSLPNGGNLLFFSNWKNDAATIAMMCNKFQYRPTVYVYSDELLDFLQFVYPLLEREIVVLSHNSDITFTDENLKVEKYPLVYRWILQNNQIINPAVFSIPIGIANAMWNHGNFSLIELARDERLEKHILCLANHSTSTAQRYRSRVDALILSQPFIMYRNGQHYHIYLQTMSMAKWCLCPRGNGLDTHRMTEALLLGAIPIVKKGEYPVSLTLPVLEVDDWFEITAEFLNDVKKPLITSDTLQQLSLKYWKELLTSFRV